MDETRLQLWGIPFLQVQHVDARHKNLRTPIEATDESDLGTSYGNKLWFYESLKGLARLDAHLVNADRHMLGLKELGPEYADARTDQITLSGLWLMGSYEWLRTFKARLVEAKHPEKKQFIQLCDKFGSVRIPLAKFEPQGAHRNKKVGGYSIARPGVSRSGTGWVVDKGVFVSRLELSNQLITALTEFDPFPGVEPLIPMRASKPLDLPEFLCDEPWPHIA
ncbi:hypothetical protein ABFG95_08005 [Achromobacter sp. HNDS-1]|uniref:Uncharacterized protein n=1 Tax=Achromobacter sp. HNDS-1 TaxID=3151598 RepID=A0AAU7LF05_9BURK